MNKPLILAVEDDAPIRNLIVNTLAVIGRLQTAARQSWKPPPTARTPYFWT